jgi:hypothetical protein
MLPILRVIPVGGVLLAITILILALNPPGDPRHRLPGVLAPANGVLISRGDHPEWWQFFLQAALRRADELSQLRLLPDTPVRVPVETQPKAEPPPAVAAVPSSRSDADPEDVTGTISQAPAAPIPVDVGESSSVELPVLPHEEQPPVITPARAKTPRESKAVPAARPSKKTAHRARRTKPPAKQEAASQFSFFEALFGDSKKPAANGRPPTSAQ